MLMGGKKFNVGIAGYGSAGKIRSQFIKSHPQLNLLAVCDKIFKNKTNLSDGTICLNNYQQLLQQPLDILFVCIHNYLAPEVTIAGLEKGLHVFCEKPPGRDIRDVMKVIECEQKHPKQKLMYGFNHRYHDSVKEAQKIIQGEELGKIINMRGVYGKSKIIRFDSEWRTKRSMAGGGILLDQGIHMVDLMRMLACTEFTNVYSFISNNFWNHDVEDNAYVLMRSEKGIIAMLHSSATEWRHRFNLEITLERGAIILAGLLTSTKSYGAETITVVYASENDATDPREVTIRYNEDNSWKEEIDDFVNNILMDNKVTHGSSYDALKTMELVYRIYCADSIWQEAFNIQRP